MTQVKQRPTEAQIRQRLQDARKAADLSVEAMAEKLNIGKWNLYKKESGEVPWALDEILRAAELFKAPTLWPWLSHDAATLLDKQLGRS